MRVSFSMFESVAFILAVMSRILLGRVSLQATSDTCFCCILYMCYCQPVDTEHYFEVGCSVACASAGDAAICRESGR